MVEPLPNLPSVGALPDVSAGSACRSGHEFRGTGAPLQAFDVTGRSSALVDDVAADPRSSGADPCMQLGSFDHYARLAKRLLGAPAALVSIVEARRQVFPGAAGLPETLMSSRQTPLEYSFCQYVVKGEKPLVITDARTDPRLHDNPAIAEFDVIAYIGYPVTDATGRTVGSVCALDSVPRAWTSDDVEVLQDLALACSTEWRRSHQVAEDGEQLAPSIIAATNIALALYDPSNELVLANEPAQRVAEVGGQDWRPVPSYLKLRVPLGNLGLLRRFPIGRLQLYRNLLEPLPLISDAFPMTVRIRDGSARHRPSGFSARPRR